VLTVTIIVPCHNEAKVIEAKVANCRFAALTVPEVVVVDDHSTDDTAELAAAAGARVILSEAPRGKWQAVRYATERVHGDIICITDADVLIDHAALEPCMGMFADHRVGAVCALRQMVRQNAQGSLEPCDGLYDTVRKAMIRFYSWLDSSPALCGPMMLLRRELVLQIGATHLRADDVDVPVQLRKLGHRAKVCPQARFAEFELTDDSQEAQAGRRAIGLAQAYWHHRGALLNPRLGLFGLLAYPMEFVFFFVTPFAAIAAWPVSIAGTLLSVPLAMVVLAGLVIEEAIALCAKSPGLSARSMHMARAIIRYMRGTEEVDGTWTSPRSTPEA